MTFRDVHRPLSENIVYINESLSPDRRTLLNKARELKRQKKLSDAWCLNGYIFVRKTEGGDKTRLRSLDHLLAIVNDD